MSSFPTWLFGLLELGRCGMSPRTSEGISRVSGRRCAALANAPRQREPLSVRPRRLVVNHVVVVTRCCLPDHRATRRAGGVAERYALAKGHQHPWAGLRKAQLVDQLPDQPQPTPAKAHQRSGAGWGAALVADRRLDPAALHPDGHLDRLRVAGPIQDGDRWAGAEPERRGACEYSGGVMASARGLPLTRLRSSPGETLCPQMRHWPAPRAPGRHPCP